MNAFLFKLALPTIMPPPSALARGIGGASGLFPKAGKLPGAISAAFKPTAGVMHQGASSAAPLVSKGFNAAAQAAGTIAPGKLTKAAAAAFFAELDGMIAAGAAPARLRGKFASADVEDLAKHAMDLQGVGQAAKGGIISGAAKALGAGKSVVGHLDRHSHAYDLAGLGVLAAPAAHGLAKNVQQARAGKKMDGVGHNVAELGGLGLIAAPVAAAMALKKH